MNKRLRVLKAAAAVAVVATFALGLRAGGAAPAQNSNAQNMNGGAAANQNTAAPSQQPVDRPQRPAQQQGPPPGFPRPELFEAIRGKENLPAEEVFKNIRQLKGVPAGRVLRAMGSFSRALGVNCGHCHVPGEWEKDDKPTKDIARGMIRMVGAINNEQLKSIPNLRPEAGVSCSTCHRGQTRPDPSLPGTRPQGGAPAPTPSPAPTPKPGS
jgi:hypothetical protein